MFVPIRDKNINNYIVINNKKINKPMKKSNKGILSDMRR